MSVILDRREEIAVSQILLDSMEELGYTPEEFIPGLMVSARILVRRGLADSALDEAVNILEEE